MVNIEEIMIGCWHKGVKKMCSLRKKFRTFRFFFLSCFQLILTLQACSCALTKFLHKRQCWVLYTTLLLSRSSSYVNQSMGYRSDHKIWVHFYANLFTCISVPWLPSQNWVFPRESPVIITKLLIGKKEYYHLKQIFLSFHWPRAYHVTCK